ncbi:MAG: hypothetical protein Q9206_005480 [Seirophora lacunosa]
MQVPSSPNDNMTALRHCSNFLTTYIFSKFQSDPAIHLAVLACRFYVSYPGGPSLELPIGPSRPERVKLAPTKKSEAGMARQKTQRPKHRNLVRWNDDMDKKLLLTIQWACNNKGVKIPWGMVGKEMGDTITESAVVQHMAKIRQRMVKEDLPVPPPLTRGGHNDRSKVHKPSASRVTKRAPKKKVSKYAERDDDDVDHDSSSSIDSDDEYKSDEEAAASAGKKAKKRTMAKRQVKKQLKSPEKLMSPIASAASNTDEETSYAVGDSMWRLTANTEAGAKADRGLSNPSSESSHDATKTCARAHVNSELSGTSRESSIQAKVLKLKISKEGFAKLGFLAERSQLGENDHYGNSYPYNTWESGADDGGNNMSAMYDAFNGMADADNFRGVVMDGNADVSGFEYGHVHRPEAFPQHHIADYGTLPSSQMDAMIHPEASAQQGSATDLLPLHHSSYYLNHANMNNFDNQAMFQGPAGMPGYGNGHLSTTTLMGGNPNFLGDDYHDIGMLDFTAPNDNPNDYYDDSQLGYAAGPPFGSPFEDHQPKRVNHQNSWESAESFQAAIGDFPGAGNITQGALTPLAGTLQQSGHFPQSYFMP